MNFTNFSDKRVFDSFWLIIEQITKSNKPNEIKLITLKSLTEFLPCIDCQNHFRLFLVKNPIIDEDNWLLKLKREIAMKKLNTPRKFCKSCKRK